MGVNKGETLEQSVPDTSDFGYFPTSNPEVTSEFSIIKIIL